MGVEKTDYQDQGIKCIVNTCYHYMSGDHCSEAMIEVHL
ncbi:DUF1540 domain-containing protein [Clostridium sp. YIM B02515]|uniref:DUF1540 domain-containing protein n=1 Tax=Clostridium rhizosphaerae TaxID=2803861 RepID=A0ABS1T955_9CLOT|nr:DUF1540 domain-containing protein [Clostridium rhizosphaerae]MBL4934553.1 DUF1540 domain-containing protein [Clostridium rhizosphaerae]